jgi:protein TonB
VIHPSSAPLRAGFLVASTVLHVAAFAMAGHPGGSRGEATMVDVAVDAPLADLVEPETPVATAEENVPRTAPPPSPPADRAAHAPLATHGPSPARQRPSTAPAAAPQAETTPSSARFALVVSNLPSTASGVVSAQGNSGASESALDEPPLAEGDVSSPARLTGSVTPAYPPAARAQEVEADVVMSIVVGPTGRVTHAAIERAAGYGFDDAALRAVREARFVPARREGSPVAVRMRWTVTFRLR